MPIPSRLAAVRCGWILVAALAAASIVPLWGVGPDLMAVVVAAIALRAGSIGGALAGLGGGWLLDLIPPGAIPLGGHAITYAAVGALVGFASRAVRVSAFVPAVAAAVAAAAVRLITGSFGFAAHPTLSVDSLGQGALGVVCTAAMGGLLIPPLLHHERRLVHRGLG